MKFRKVEWILRLFTNKFCFIAIYLSALFLELEIQLLISDTNRYKLTQSFAKMNTRYVTSNRGLIKIIEIIVGVIICSLLCYKWYGGQNCFGEGRVGFASGLNFVILVSDI